MTAVQPANARLRLIKLIHVGKRELSMDEPTYRTMLQSAGKASSTSNMGVPALMAVFERMKRDGFQVRPKAGDRRQTMNPQASKVRALWLLLHALGVVRDPSEAALASYVKRVAKVDDLRWARGEATAVLIETLKKWAMRFLPEAVAEMKVEAARLHQAQPFTPEQIEIINMALAGLQRGQGFDMYLCAWEALSDVLGRDVSDEIKVLKATP